MADKGTESKTPLPDLVLPVSENSLIIRFPNTSEYQQSRKTLEKDGYVFEEDSETGELVANKRIVVKGNKT